MNVRYLVKGKMMMMFCDGEPLMRCCEPSGKVWSFSHSNSAMPISSAPSRSFTLGWILQVYGGVWLWPYGYISAPTSVMLNCALSHWKVKWAVKIYDIMKIFRSYGNGSGNGMHYNMHAQQKFPHINSLFRRRGRRRRYSYLK